MQLKQLFTEKYRPQTLEEICLPKRYKILFENGITQNYILNGPPGTGKSSLAKVISKEFKHETLFINASSEGRIDYIRDEISSFCSTAVLDKSRYNQFKLVILDEVDGASLKFFEAFRGFVEKFTNVRFILTCNNINKIPDYIQSRFYILDFNFTNDKKEMTSLFGKRMVKIMKEDGIKYADKKTILNFINKHYPKYRNMLVKLNELKDSNREELTQDIVDEDIINYPFLLEMIFNNISPEETYKKCGVLKGQEDMVFNYLYEDIENYLINSDESDRFIKLFRIADVFREVQYHSNFVKDKYILLLSLIHKLQNIQ